MLFNIYLTTVLVNLGVSIATLGAFLIKTKIYGYKWRKSSMPKEAILGIAIGLSIDSIIPVLNVFSIIKKLCKFNSIVNELIFKFEQQEVIYDNSICNDEKFKTIDERIAISELAMEAKCNGDITGKEMTESMYLEGASKIEIKNELQNSKKERDEILKKDKSDEVQKFVDDMLVETELNCELSLNEKEKLLKLYKKALLSKRFNIEPIEMAENISTKNYIKTKKENK